MRFSKKFIGDLSNNHKNPHNAESFLTKVLKWYMFTRALKALFYLLGPVLLIVLFFYGFDTLVSWFDWFIQTMKDFANAILEKARTLF